MVWYLYLSESPCSHLLTAGAVTPSLLAISSCVIFLLFRYFRITSPTCIHLPPSQPCCFLWIYLIRYVCVSPVSRYEIKVKKINHGSFWVVADQKHLFCIFLKFIPRFLQFYVVVLFELIDHTRDHIRLAGIQVHHRKYSHLFADS